MCGFGLEDPTVVVGREILDVAFHTVQKFHIFPEILCQDDLQSLSSPLRSQALQVGPALIRQIDLLAVFITYL